MAVTHSKVLTVADDPPSSPDVAHPSDWNANHTGTIDDSMHGARTLASAHRHGDLANIGTDDHHAKAHVHLADGSGTIAHSSLSSVTATDHHAAPVAGPDADITVDVAGAAGTAGAFARSGHGHKLATSATVAVAVGTASAGTSGHSPSRDDHVHPSGAGTPSTQAFGDAAATGAGPAAAMTDHKHAMPADPRSTLAQVATAQALGTADTYVTSSAITIPAGLRAGTILRWRIFVTKTAAGVAAPIIQIRFGTNGTTADTSRVSITGNAQTAAIDKGVFIVECLVTATGATGNVLGMMWLFHQLSTTGLSLGDWGLQALSANFDLTTASLKAGISITPGASAAWTVDRIVTEIQP